MEQTAQSPLYSPQFAFTISANEAILKPTPMLKLDRLAMAIAEQEGWKAPNPAEKYQGSRSYRNSNPGNLRSSPFQVGTDGGFAVFNTAMDGWAALKWDLKQKAIGNTRTGLNGDSTIKELIFKWAPVDDQNDPQSYLNNVCKMTGFTPETKLKELI